jgi:N-acetylglucosaminyldiphosphoundecaprenol N-acetyl-beta-D-mannosaminyltransferase
MINKIIKKILKEDEFFGRLGDDELITFINPYSYYLTRRRLFCDSFSAYGVDGILLVLFVRFFSTVKVQRLSLDFTSLANGFFNCIINKNLSLFVVGSDVKTLSKFSSIIKSLYPGLTIAGASSGFFKNEVELDNCLSRIKSSGANVVLCGMGAIKQEEFLIRLKDSGWRGTGVTCGGFIHQTAKSGGGYYPYFFDKFDLRAIYRLYDEPKLFYRYFFIYPLAVFYVIHDFMFVGDVND